MRILTFIICIGLGYFAGIVTRGHLGQEAALSAEEKIAERTTPPNAVPKQNDKSRQILPREIRERSDELKEKARATAEQALNKRKKDYIDLFTEFGLDGATIAQLTHHIGKIYQAKAEVANEMSVLQSTKDSYDEQIRRLVGNHYDEYMAYENRYSATVEVSHLKTAAAALNVTITGEEERAITDLIQKNGALTFNSFADMGTPYGEVMPPLIGKEFAPGVQKQVTRLGPQVQQIVEQAKKNGMSDTSIQAIRNYYGGELDRYQQWIERFGPTSRN